LSSSSIGLIAGLSSGLVLILTIATSLIWRTIRRRRAIIKNIGVPDIQTESQLETLIGATLMNLRTENIMRTQMPSRLVEMSEIDFTM